MKCIFTGGGTLGSVTPLLAIWEALQKECKGILRVEALWIGTQGGVEHTLLKEYGIPSISIFSAKLRRYWSWKNFFSPIFFMLGMIQSLWIIFRFKPDIIVHAGGYVGVPVIIAGWILEKKSIIFQLDIEPSLANMIVSPFATRVGVACEEERMHYSSSKTEIIGIPVRSDIHIWSDDTKRRAARKTFFLPLGIQDTEKVVLVVGGGTGAAAINTLIWDALPSLTKECHVIHLVGRGKMASPMQSHDRYHPFEFLGKDFIPYLALSDIIITRAGMGILSECAALKKALIIIPIPHSHQEKNATYFCKREAALCLSQNTVTPDECIVTIRRLLNDSKLSDMISTRIHNAFPKDATERAITLMKSLVHTSV